MPLRGLACASADTATDFVLAEVPSSRNSADAVFTPCRDVGFGFCVPISLFASCRSSIRHSLAFVEMNASKVKQSCNIGIVHRLAVYPCASRSSNQDSSIGWDPMGSNGEEVRWHTSLTSIPP